MNHEMFPSFSMYPALPTPPTPYEEFTKSLMMKLSLQNFFINMLSMDSFNDLMAIHQKIDEMFQGILHRQPSNSFFPMPANNLPMDHSTFNFTNLQNQRRRPVEILITDDNIRALTREEINKIPIISFTKKIKKFKKTKHTSHPKENAKKIWSDLESSSSSSSENDQNEPTAYTTCCICLSDYKVREKIRILNCKHRFHKKCIDSWLQEKNVCPLCKFTQ